MEQTEEKKKGFFAKTSTKIVTILLAVVIAAAGVTVGLVKADVFTSPEKAVDHALESLGSENVTPAFEEVFGLAKLLENSAKKGADISFRVTAKDIPVPEELTGMSGYVLPSAGVTGTTLLDFSGKKASTVLKLTAADTALLGLQVYADETQLMLALPELFQSVLSVNYAGDNLLERICASPLFALLELDEAEFRELLQSLNTEDSAEMTAEFTKAIEKMAEEIEQSAKEFYRTRTVSKTETKELTVGGKNVKAKGYVMTFDKEALSEFLKAYMDAVLCAMEQMEQVGAGAVTVNGSREEIAAALEELKGELSDLEYTIYTYKKRVAEIEVKTRISGQKLVCTVELDAAGSSFDNMTVSVRYETEDVDVDFKLTHETENTKEGYTSKWVAKVNGVKISLRTAYDKVRGDLDMVLNLAGEIEGRLSGEISELDRGNKLVFAVQELSLTEYGETTTLPIDAELGLAVLSEEVTAPEGTPKDLLTMTEEDLNAVVMEAYMNLMGLINTLVGFMQ